MDSEIKLVVFDWAGTTIDFGSQAPMQVFRRTFSQYGLSFTREEINAPMGMEKKMHIRTMLSTDHGKALWKSAMGRDWNETDIEELYEQFEVHLHEVVRAYSKVIPGVPEAVQALRRLQIKIGSTTGYTSEIMQDVLPEAEQGAYEPDCVVTPDLTGIGRPAPFMMFECMRKTGVWNVSHVVKVGDTVTDILEGKNAGAWSIGVLKGSSLMDLQEKEYEELSPAERQVRKDQAKKKYLACLTSWKKQEMPWLGIM